MPWPITKTPQADSYSTAPVNAVRRTEMEVGPPKQQRYRDRRLLQRTVVYFVTEAERNAFVTFVETEINRGADFFDWPDPITSTTRQARIVGGRYQDAPMNSWHSHWRLQMQLETYES